MGIEGTKSVNKVAKHFNRKYIGYDTEEKFVELTTRRLEEPLNIREKQLYAKFEKI